MISSVGAYLLCAGPVGPQGPQGIVVDQGGTKSEPFGSAPKSSAIFTNNGRFSVIITRADIPKFASNNRTTGTVEENKAAVQGSIAYFRTYSANDADKTLTMHIDDSTYPNWAGMDQKRTVQLSGDDLKYTNASPSMGQGIVTVTWKRIKGSQPTAQR
jgi:hypothetical protein